MEKIAKRKKTRGAHRGSAKKMVTKIAEKLQSASAEDKNWLKQQRLALKEKIEVLKNLDREILTLMADVDQEEIEIDMEKEIEEADNLSSELMKAVIDIDELIENFSTRENSGTVPGTAPIVHVQATTKTVRAKLPKLEVRKFSGHMQDWQEFWESFESAVHNNEELSVIDKFSYLKGLLSDQAMTTIAGFSLTTANYEAAIDLLKNRFGRKSAIQRAHINELLKIQPVFGEKDTVRLRKMYDTCETHYRGLKALGVDELSYSTIVVPSIMEKLPEQFRLTITRGAEFLDWNMEDMLKAFAKELDLREIHAMSPSSNLKKPTSALTATAHALLTSKNENCAFCLKPHPHEDCKKVQDVETRKQLARKFARCFVCLRKNHRARECKSNLTCKGCGGSHHLALCSSQGARVLSEPSNPVVSSSGMHHIKSGGRVALQTAQGIAKGKKEDRVRVLLDSGSHRSFMTFETAKIIEPKIVRQEWLQVSTFGQKSEEARLRDVAEVEIRSVQGDKVASIEVFIVPQISTIHNYHVEVAKKQYSHLKGLWFSDVNRQKEELVIDILIGADYLWNFQKTEVIRGRPEEPVAIQTGLGWVLSGPLVARESSDSCSKVQVNFVGQESVGTRNLSTADSVNRLWDLETLGIRECDEVHEEFLDSIRFTGERYSVRLPWKEGQEELPSNYAKSLVRLKSQVRRLEKEPGVLEEYDSIIKQQLKDGIIERVMNLEKAEKVHYLPHQGVVRKDAVTTKLRIVYDASCKADNGVSLNDCLHVGPSLSPLLFDILLRFRTFRVALVADIEKAFLNVEVEQEDRDCLRFLWADNVLEGDMNASVYRFARVVFGLNSSPFLLNATLRYHFSTFEKEDKEFAKKMVESFYVDDMVSGDNDKDAAFDLYVKTKDRLGKGGFKLRKWVTNNKYLEEQIQSQDEGEMICKLVSRLDDEESYASTTVNAHVNSNGQKVLGQSWDRHSDSFQFELASVGVKAQGLNCTKRNMLKVLAGIFDPLGIISPIVVTAKICFQQVCKKGVGWDDELPEDVQRQWKEWCKDLHYVGAIQIDRCLFEHADNELLECYLHGFGDASQKGYCAVIYFVYYTNNGVHVRLLTSKTRVAPLKEMSIPRLELMSARILAQLMDVVKNALNSQVKLTGTRMWLDSVTALHWIRNRGEWKQFVRHRVDEILKLTHKVDWGHCPGVENPADLGSRGVAGTKLKGESLWWQGPSWLSGPQEGWPAEEVILPKGPEIREEELKSAALVVSADVVHDITTVIDLSRHSNIEKVYRITAWIRRFVQNLRVKADQRRFGRLEVNELLAAEKEWIICIQSKLQNQSNFCQLKTSLGLSCQQEILRCKGRLGESDLEYEGKYPIILPRNHRFTKLIIEKSHKIAKHSGVRGTLAELRTRFWVPKGRQMVKAVISRCVICRKFEGKPCRPPPTADLPEFRVRQTAPFTNTGVDFAGPLSIKGTGNSIEKAYIALFTCCVTRAIHLDLVGDLSAPAFLRCLRRFVSRRGTPAKMVSDNAKTFKAADKALKELYNHPEIQADLENRRIVWRFNLERAPWWGGFFERMVGCTKQVLRKTLGNALMTYDELLTVLVEVEGTLNNRPLTYSYDEPEAEVLTPSHLILGRRLTMLPDNVIEEDDWKEDDSKKRFKYLSVKLAHFWLRWQREYLADLREFHKVKRLDKRPILKKGDVVIVDGEGKKRGTWKTAVVESVIRGNDNEVRGAKVRLLVKGKPTLLSRPVQKLYPLEIQAQSKDDTTQKANKKQKELPVKRNPRRAAADAARERIQQIVES